MGSKLPIKWRTTFFSHQTCGVCSELAWVRQRMGRCPYKTTFTMMGNSFLWVHTKKSCTTWDVKKTVNNEIDCPPQLVSQISSINSIPFGFSWVKAIYSLIWTWSNAGPNSWQFGDIDSVNSQFLGGGFIHIGNFQLDKLRGKLAIG